ALNQYDSWRFNLIGHSPAIVENRDEFSTTLTGAPTCAQPRSISIMMKRVELKEISVGSRSSMVKTASLRRALVVCCLLTLSAMMLALPDALPRVRAGARQEQAGKDKNQNKAPGNVTTQGATKTAAPDEDEGEDPDLPPGFSGRIDKEAYHAGRSDQINLWRGMEPGKPFDVTGRSRAIQHMEAQRNSPSSPQTSGTMWTQIGPAPIPLGQ